MIKNQWYAIASSHEIKEGKPLGMKRLGMRIALFRVDQVLSCVMDLCSHRGANLSKGNIKDGHLKCPFHGLEFNSKGECQLIPANGRASEEDLSRYNVKAIPVREVQGTVFLWYGDEEPDKEPDFFEELDSSFAVDEIKDHWKTHYSRAIENQLDVVHLPFVHHNTIGRGKKTLVNGPKVLWLDENTLQTSADNEKDRGQTPKKSKDAQIKGTHLTFKFPNVWMNTISDKMKVVGLFVPIDESNTLVYFRFYTKLTGWKAFDKNLARLGKVGNLIIERQDKRVVITQRPKASSYQQSTEKLMAGDLPIIEYRRHRQLLQELGEKENSFSKN